LLLVLLHWDVVVALRSACLVVTLVVMVLLLLHVCCVGVCKRERE